MGIPKVSGQGLPQTLSANAPLTVLVNATMATMLWSGEDPIGRRIKLTSFDQDAPWFTVGGVVGDTRQTGLDSSLRPQVYVEQRVDPSQQMVVVLRASGDPIGYAAVARAAVMEADRDQPVGRIRPMRSVVAESVANRRFTMALVGAFAVLAFALLVGLTPWCRTRLPSGRERMSGARRQPDGTTALVLAEGYARRNGGVRSGHAFRMTLHVGALFGVAPRRADVRVADSALRGRRHRLSGPRPPRDARRPDRRAQGGMSSRGCALEPPGAWPYSPAA